MGTIPDAVATKISEIAVDQGISGAHYLCCFNKIVEEFDKERQNLLVNRQSVQDHGKQAINQNENISKHVKHWEERADKLIQEDTKTNKTCFFGWFPNCIWRYRRGKDLKEKTQEINKLITECKDYIKFSLPSTLPDVEYYSTEGFVEFESRKSASKELLDALKDGGHYVIGLWGIGGAGKTTLATQVGKEVKESGLFEHVIRVTVSKTPTIKNIQHKIASPLIPNFNLVKELDRAERLWMRLTNGEKILIILDDVWEELNFEDIGIPSSNDHKNCRVLLTTRNKEVCKSMGCSTPIELGLLSKEESWLLFQECADLGKDARKTLKNKGQQIAEECKGLPLAITTIASTLRGEEEKEWDMALRSLRSIDHNDEDLIKIYKRLKVSYDYLKGKGAQELFLLCSVFPEDYEISMEDLTIYAIGLGLSEEVNSFQKARDHLHRTKKKLIDSCLLLKANKVKEECVKMHDLLHDLAHWMQKGEIKVITEHGDNQNAQRKEIVEEKSSLRYLYCKKRNDFLDLLNCPKLEILILEFGSGLSMIDIPDTIFEGMKDLKVCTLSGRGLLKSPSLPKSFEVLKSLRALTLRSLSLGDISVLEKLQMLESLRLEYCSFYEVPSGIVQLKKLKLLSLKECDIEKNPFEVMGQIVLQLEELYFIPDVYSEVVTEFLNKCPPLKRYHIQLASQSGQQLSLNGSISRALSIANFGASTSNTTVNDLIKRAEVLHLHKLQGGYKTIIPDFFEAIGDMNELIEIILNSCSEIEFLVDTTKGCSSVGTGFSKLAEVGLIGMGHLKALCQGPPLDFLKNIQKMDVTDCHKLTSLFTLPIAQSLVLLKELSIFHCEAMESMITVDSEEKVKEIVENDHDQLRLFPKLEKLCIKYCPPFKGLLSVDSNERQLLEVTASWESQSSDSQCSHPFDTPQFLLRQSLICRNIRKLTIVSCHKLTSLFAVSVLQTGLLETLEIESCDGLKHIITDDNNVHDHKMYNSVMPKLNYLRVARCSQLKYVIGQSHHDDHLSDPYYNIQIQIDFPALEHLKLERLPSMISICQNNFHPKLLALQEFQSMQCPQFTITTIRQLDCLTRKDQRGTIANSPDLTKELGNEGLLNKASLVDQQPIGQAKESQSSDSQCSHPFDTPQFLLRQSLICSNIRKMTIVSCHKLTSLFAVSVLQTGLLETLEIESCHGLKHIITDDNNVHDHKMYNSVMPKLNYISVEGCSQLKYVIGQSHHEDHLSDPYDNVQIQIDFPALERLQLRRLPSMISICQNNCHPELLAMRKFELMECPQFTITTIRQLDCLTRKENRILSLKKLGGLEMLTVPSISIDSELIKISSTSTSRTHDNELGNEGLLNEASLVDQQPIGQTKESQSSDSQCSHPFDTPQFLLRQSLICRNVRTMIIVRCHKLTSLFAVSVLQTMSLERLYIRSCNVLEHIIIDDINVHGHKMYNSVMPKLNYLSVEGCSQLKYVIGQSHREDHLSDPYDYVQIQIDFPALERLQLRRLPSMISICQNNCHPELLAMRKFELMECPQFTITTIRQLDCLTRKDSGMIMDTLEELMMTAMSHVESIFCLEVSGQDVISRLKYLILVDVSRMSYIFKGPKHMLSLENLINLSLRGCGKLKVIISTSLVRSFPKLKGLIIADCDALEKIVEEDEENQTITNPCFPELEYILVRNCRKLKRLFCMNTLDEFPKLFHLLIADTSDLEQVFGGSDHCKREEAMQNNVLPKLETVMLVQLPSLTNVWPHKLQTVENLFLHNCPKLSLRSTRGWEDLIICARRPGVHDNYHIDNEYSWSWNRMVDLINYGEDSESELSSSQSNQEKENIIIEEIEASEMAIAPSVSTDSTLIKIPPASTLRMHDNELGNEGLTNEASLVDQQAIRKTKDFVEKVPKEPSSDAVQDYRSTNEVGERLEKPSDVAQKTSLQELGNEELINETCLVDQQLVIGETKDQRGTIANSPHLTKESLERESSMETTMINPVEAEKAKFDIHSDDSQNVIQPHIEGSVQESSIPHITKTVTPSKSVRSPPDVAKKISLQKIFKMDNSFLLEKGRKEPPSNREDRNNNEANDRVEKPPNVGQNTSLQSNKETTEHGVIDSRESEKAEDGETVGQSVEEITNPPPATLIPSLKESALELVEKESSNQAITMDQMAFGKTESDDMKQRVQDGYVSHIAKIVTSSQTEGSTSGLLVASLPKTSPQDFVEKESKESNSKDDAVQQDRSSNKAGERLERQFDIAQNTSSLAPIKGLQTRTELNEDAQENFLDPQNLMGDIFSLFDSMEKDNRLVDKAFANLETYLNMPLKDIVRSESTNNGLVNALKFLLSWSSENGSSLEALKATIDSLLPNIPSILSSFTALKEKHKSVMKELPQRKEVANALEKSIVDAQQRKAYLKEKFDRLQAELKSTENEIKEHEHHLLSLEDQKEKLHVEIANFFKEFETIKKNKFEMVGDRSKAHEQLLEANYD